MCGIFGIIKFDGTVPTEIELKTGNDLAAHRGPDDSGIYQMDAVGLAHRRLSILDLSVDGHQPMLLADRYAITYNGEIYNYIEIREELRLLGHSFRSQSDTEVILAAYDQWGEDCVRRFNGMWAFAIHDRKAGTLFCSRDRFGVKPFHYLQTEQQFVFASEIKQLLPFLKNRQPDWRVLDEYLSRGVGEHRPETFFRGIIKLPAAHSMTITHAYGEISPKRYFTIEIHPALDLLGEDAAISAVRESLTRSVELRLRSDVQVGSCLSGGLDSSCIVAIASPLYRSKAGVPFTAIHAQSIELKTDESHYAKSVASKCDLNLHIIKPKLEEMTAIVDEVVYTQEEPFNGPSIIMQYFVMREAKRLGCTVMLDGQGGDETLYGYEAYFAPYFARAFSKGHFYSAIRGLLSLNNFKFPKWKILAEIIFLLIPILRNLENTLRLLLRPFKYKLDSETIRRMYSLVGFKSFQIREMELSSLPVLLRHEDRNSMRHGIETRLPFVDYRFVETAISLNDNLKFKNGWLKYLLRKAFDGHLPDDVIWRTSKFGFEAPTNTWLKDLRPKMLREISDSQILRGRFDPHRVAKCDQSSLWRLYNVAVWERMFGIVGDAK